MNDTKQCTKCNVQKSLVCFSGDRHSPDGRTYRCRDCKKEDRRSPERRKYMQEYSQKGYVLGNIAVISWKANKLKSDGTINEHRQIAQYIRSFGEPDAPQETNS